MKNFSNRNKISKYKIQSIANFSAHSIDWIIKSCWGRIIKLCSTYRSSTLYSNQCFKFLKCLKLKESLFKSTVIDIAITNQTNLSLYVHKAKKERTYEPNSKFDKT
jgi:hypothetical protein